jgi:zinc/manganese transport system permease protein
VSLDTLDLSILGPALLAGILVLATHVPMGREVLKRGIIFIDLAVAQVAGLGVIAADRMDLHLGGFGVELAAGAAALVGALLLTWTERHFPEIQEALIGILFILAATGGILLLADNPHGGERLKDLLVGQILWLSFSSLWPVALLYAAVLTVWFRFEGTRGRIAFYLLFAVTVTASVQLVGVYLVFASLIIPAVPTRNRERRRGLIEAFLLGLGGYVLGLVLSALFDLPTGAMIVWTLAVLAVLWMLLQRDVDGRVQRGPHRG